MGVSGFMNRIFFSIFKARTTMEISYCNFIVLSFTMKVVTGNYYFFVSNKLNSTQQRGSSFFRGWASVMKQTAA